MGGELFEWRSTRWMVESEIFVRQISRSRRSRVIGVGVVDIEGGKWDMIRCVYRVFLNAMSRRT